MLVLYYYTFIDSHKVFTRDTFARFFLRNNPYNDLSKQKPINPSRLQNIKKIEIIKYIEKNFNVFIHELEVMNDLKIKMSQENIQIFYIQSRIL